MFFRSVIVAKTDQHPSLSKKGDYWSNSFAPQELSGDNNILSIEILSLNGKCGEISAKSRGAGNMQGSSFTIHRSDTVVPRKDSGERRMREKGG
jgi:hypothetical protein